MAVRRAAMLAGPGAGGAAGADTNTQVIPTTPTGAVTCQHEAVLVANTTGVDGVIAYDTSGRPAPGTADAGSLEHNHVTGPVVYSVVPPVGGRHNVTRMNAGVHTQPIPSGCAVHNLEHGAVWITYRPDLSAVHVKARTAFVTARKLLYEGLRGPNGTPQANRFVDMSPWVDDSLPAPIVISSWGYQPNVTSPSDPRLLQFVQVVRRNATYPPEDSKPIDAIAVHIGGQPATDGSEAANPP